MLMSDIIVVICTALMGGALIWVLFSERRSDEDTDKSSSSNENKEGKENDNV